MTSKRILFSVLPLLMLASCNGGGAPGERAVNATENQRFEPSTLTVSAGTTVAFTNTSSQPHTVTAYQDGIPEGAEYFSSGGLDSEEKARSQIETALLADQETYEVTFDEPGTYEYFCIPHEDQGMKGTIVVE